MKVYNIALTYDQRRKLDRLGGARWVRAMIDKEVVDYSEWRTREERNALIAADPRPAAAIARDYDISRATVSTIKRRARKNNS